MTTYNILPLICAVLTGTSHASVPDSPSKTTTRTEPVVAVEFEENKGQFDLATAFVGQTPDYQVHILNNGQTNIQLMPDHSNGVDQAITFDFFPGVEPTAIQGQQPSPHKVNYLMGERKNWITNVSNYTKIKMNHEQLGIDLIFYDNKQRLEYDFYVKPQVDPKKIHVSISGADSIKLDDEGNLVLQKDQHHFVQHKPFAYQFNNQGHKTEIPVKYNLLVDGFGFHVSAYDTSQPLIIDPIIEYSTYLGGTGNDRSLATDVDGSDHIFQLSLTSSPNLSTAGAYQDNPGTVRRVYQRYAPCAPCAEGSTLRDQVTGRAHSVLITKYSPDGQNKIYSTYMSSPSEQLLNGSGIQMKVSETGEVAFSMHDLLVDDLPLVNESSSFSTEHRNGYVAKLNAAGDDLVFATYLKLGSIDGYWGIIRDIEISPLGEVAIVGNVSATQLQDTGALEVNPIAGQSCVLNFASQDYFDGYVMKFDPIGQVSFASCLGGENYGPSGISESMRQVKFTPDGKLYIVGRTSATDIPIVNGFQTGLSANGPDLYLALINPVNSAIEWSSYYGSFTSSFTFVLDDIYDDFDNSDTIYPYELMLDAEQNMIVVGHTNINTFDSQNVAQTNLNYPDAFDPSKPDHYGDFTDFFVLKINPSTGAEWFTYLGGSYEELPFVDAAIDQQGHVYVYGLTTSTDYPLSNAMQSVATGTESAVISKITKHGGLAFSTYFGGSDEHRNSRPGGIAINSQNKIIIGGQSEVDDFPISLDGDPRVFGFDATLTVFNQSDLSDGDGDGVPDSTDAFPADANEWQNNDGDTEGNFADLDDDNDNVADALDHFPYDASKQLDNDRDGVSNDLDFWPDGYYEVFDTDGDGEGDVNDDDADNDRINDNYDEFQLDPTESVDHDNDGVGNFADPDDDGDGTLDEADADDTNADIPIFTFEEFNPQGELPINHLLPYGFDQVHGAALWSVDDSQHYHGEQSLASLPIGDNQAAGVTYAGPLREGVVSFYYKVDSELNHDFLTFTLDGQELLHVSGDVDWTEFSVPVAAGDHTLTWVYQKDGTNSIGEDSAAIDHISGLLTKPVDIAAYITPYDMNTTPLILPTGDTFVHRIDVYNYESTQTENVTVSFNLGTDASIENVLSSCFNFDNSTVTNFCNKTPRPINNSETFLMSFPDNGHIRFYIHSQVLGIETDVTFNVSATANDAVLDLDLSNDMETINYRTGIFGTGFD